MTRKAVPPSEPFTTPMPPVKPVKKTLSVWHEHGAMQDVLVARGVKWPLSGYAPGRYLCKCHDCGEQHTADRRASQCLPCAVVQAMDNSEKSRGSAFDFGKRAGRAGLIDEIRKLADGEAA